MGNKSKKEKRGGDFINISEKSISLGMLGEGKSQKHLPIFTKHRKNKGQFKRKQNHWSQNATKN